MNATTRLGTCLRQARELSDLSQQETAALVGVPREVVSYWENDRRVPSLAQLHRLAEMYGVPPGSLLGTDPEPIASEEHELLYRDLRRQEPRTKTEVRRWLSFLDDWAGVLEQGGVPLPGRSAPPERSWRSAEAITDSRRAAKLAAEVRRHYELGHDAIPDLTAFLDQQGILVYRIALDRIGDAGGVSGVFYNHPRLGSCVLVNTDTTPGRQTFTLAHEFAHALFHYQERGLVSRAGDPDRKERFADAFAAHFLVPGEKLSELVAESPHGHVTDPLAVIQLHRHFRVSYATMLNRLRSENHLSPERYEAYRQYSPSRLAATLGLDGADYVPSSGTPGVTLGSYPASVLGRVRTMVRDDELTPAGAADLLNVAQEELLGELLATPEPASDRESREFLELPMPAGSRRKARAAQD